MATAECEREQMHRRGSAILGLLGLVALGACGDKFETCDDCAPASGGSLSSGGSEATGGSSTGGTEDTGGTDGSGGAENTGGAEKTGGMGGIPFSCDECSSATEPVCDEMEEECVQCLPVVDESECVGTNTPVCGPENTCVQCTEDRDNACTTDRPYCSPENECVQCLSNDECPEGTLPICSDGECVPCSGDESCVDLGNVCLSTGECVECSVEQDDRLSDEDSCGTGVCNPETNECEGSLSQASKGGCLPCIADNECVEGYNCVPMFFSPQGEEPKALGGFCLKVYPGCERPFEGGAVKRASLSGAAPINYCGIAEQFTTCEAIADLAAGRECSMPMDCGTGSGEGLCESVNGSLETKCTYKCTAAAQCVEGFDCAGTDQAKYCGGVNP